MSKIFGDNLKRLRNHWGLTQEQAAAAVKITRPAYASYEENRADPSQETLKKIADRFGVTNLYGLLYDDKFLKTKESCVFDERIASQEYRLVLNKYLKTNPSIRRAIDILLAIK